MYQCIAVPKRVPNILYDTFELAERFSSNGGKKQIESRLLRYMAACIGENAFQLVRANASDYINKNEMRYVVKKNFSRALLPLFLEFSKGMDTIDIRTLRSNLYCTPAQVKISVIAAMAEHPIGQPYIAAFGIVLADAHWAAMMLSHFAANERPISSAFAPDYSIEIAGVRWSASRVSPDNLKRTENAATALVVTYEFMLNNLPKEQTNEIMELLDAKGLVGKRVF